MISDADIYNASILIVDDQEANIALLEQMLSEAGYKNVTATQDPSAVCELERKSCYNLILLDLQMPVMDGFQVIDGLKEAKPDCHTPILVITAQPKHKLRALKAGARDFVSKPFDLTEVLTRVHNLLEVHLLHLKSQKLYEQIVEEQKVSERLLKVFRSGPVAVHISTVTGGIIVDANDQCCAFFGYTREELIQQSVERLGLWANYEERDAIVARLTSGYLVRDIEMLLKRRSGELRTVSISFELTELPGNNERVMISMFNDITDRKRAEAELEQVHRELLETSRLVGMAEVATGILHNVGNVLNSVNVASTCMGTILKKSKTADLKRVADLIRDQGGNLGEFMTADPRGKHIVEYLAQLALHLNDEQAAMLSELGELQKFVDHIKAIVKMQQGFAKVPGLRELVNVADLVEDALKMNAGGLIRHNILVTREFEEIPAFLVEKHKLLQILVNLIRNAKDACSVSRQDGKQVIIRVRSTASSVRISIGDNGIGIQPENLTRIFAHGFTTKKDGHGFGLHSGVLAAHEMGGSLSVYSDGIGTGATFTVELPCKTTEAVL